MSASPARVRFTTSGPGLRPIKAWTTYEPKQQVGGFKQQLGKLAGAQDAQAVVLELDGFEVLDHLSCEVFDPSKDILTVRLASTADASSSTQAAPKPVKAVNGITVSTQPAALQDDSSDLSSEDKWENESESSSSEDSSSEDSSSEASSSGSSHRPTQSNSAKRINANPAGAGTARTRARNARKRKKMRFERARREGGLNAERTARLPPITPAVVIPSAKPVNGVSSDSSSSDLTSDSSSTGSPPSVAAVLPTGPTVTAHLTDAPLSGDPSKVTLTMMSLANKNKRKNKRKAKSPPVERKIYFGDPAPLPPQPASPRYTPQSPRLSAAQVDPVAIPLPASPPLHRTDPAPPPSLRPAHQIPANVFITGVDVEAPDWVPGKVGWDGVKHGGGGRKGKGAKARKRALVPEFTGWKDYSEGKIQGSGFEEVTPATNGVEGHHYEEDDIANGQPDEEVMQDIEDAYADFIATGGYAGGPAAERLYDADPLNGWDGWPEIEEVKSEWDSLKKLEKAEIEPEAMIAIRVYELNAATLSPELATYHGSVVATTEAEVTLSVHPSAVPSAESEAYGDPDGAADSSMYGHRHERKEMRKQALFDQLWQTGDGEAEPEAGWGVRTWSWTEIVETRRLFDDAA